MSTRRTILDKFLNEEEKKTVSEKIKKLDYELSHSVSETGTKKYNFLSSVNIDNEIQDIFLKMFEIEAIKKSSSNKIFERWYVNLAPAGEWHSGEWHSDDGNITALYYPESWKTEWGGGTEFYDGEIVDYVENRLLLFDAKSLHRSLPHYNQTGWRYTLAFKTNFVWND